MPGGGGAGGAPMSEPLVIIGAGAAGYGLLRALRHAEPRRRIWVITADDGSAYAKSQLTSALGRSKEAVELVVATADQIAHRYDATILTRQKVQRIDRERKELVTASGTQPYGQLVIATGAEPVPPSALRGTAAAAVLTLGSLGDYAYLRRQLAGRSRVLVLGGDLDGCETAAALVRASCDVTLLEPRNRLLGGTMPGLFAARVERALRDRGVRVMIEDGLQRLDHDPDGLDATTLAGLHLSAEVAVAALGSRPRVAIAQDAGLAVRRGIVVDAGLRTADPDIFAVGECAELDQRGFRLVEDIDAGVQTLAAILAGHRSARVRRQPRLQRLQIEGCALVLCEPPPMSGEWQETATAQGVVSLFHDHHGRLRGFALAGQKVHEAARLLAQVAA